MSFGEARRSRTFATLAGAAAATLPIAWLWGFSVDDAFIIARVAAHIARGFGHRFNMHGPVVDAVTPLGFAYFLAPFAKSGVLGAMYFAKGSGAASGAAAGACIGWFVHGAGSGRRRYAVLAVLAVSAPFGAWCAAGMETGHVALLCTLALFPGLGGTAAAGVAAALRPELVPWTVALAVGRSAANRERAGRAAVRVALALGPALAVLLIRFAVFGRAVPLAFVAKPSDPDHGLRYVLGALLWSGAPLLVLAPRSIARLGPGSRAILAAALVHAVSIVFAGGDWMALFRLFVPILPGLFVVGAELATLASTWATVVRWIVAFGTSLTLFVSKGNVARHVLAQRLSLISAARPELERASHPAALDVGWVGAATDADIVDLAGVTDDAIAELPGGHTSKRLPERLLARRQVDAVILLAARGSAADPFRRSWARVVEARAARQAEGLGFVLRASLELSGTDEEYLVFVPRDLR